MWQISPQFASLAFWLWIFMREITKDISNIVSLVTDNILIMLVCFNKLLSEAGLISIIILFWNTRNSGFPFTVRLLKPGQRYHVSSETAKKKGSSFAGSVFPACGNKTSTELFNQLKLPYKFLCDSLVLQCFGSTAYITSTCYCFHRKWTLSQNAVFRLKNFKLSKINIKNVLGITFLH